MRRGSTTRGRRRSSGSTHGGLAYWVACARELFEEAGLLLATTERRRRRSTRRRRRSTARLVAHRARSTRARGGSSTCSPRSGLVLDATRCRTSRTGSRPIGPPRRYDTRFFVAAAPVGPGPDPRRQRARGEHVGDADRGARAPPRRRDAADPADDQEPRGDRAVRLVRRTARRGAAATSVPTIEPRIVAGRQRRADPAARRRGLRRATSTRTTWRRARSTTRRSTAASDEASSAGERARARCRTARPGQRASPACRVALLDTVTRDSPRRTPR